MNAERKRRLKRLFDAALSVLAIVGVYLVLFLHGITCPIKWLTGISCPGCGMSRAFFSFLRFDFAAAFGYHPVIFAMPVFAALYALFYFKGMKRSLKVVVCTFVSVMAVTYFLRFFTDNSVVVFEPSEGVVVRIIKRIFN